MSVDILMPALSPTMEEGTLSKWLVKEGDKVESGDLIAEIETDKATMEVEAIEDGIIGKILVSEGQESIKVNSPIAILLSEGENLSENAISTDSNKEIKKEELQEKINALMEEDHKITYEYIDSKILESQPELVRTMSVKPPSIDGKLRFVKIGNVDFQPCGGTHVKSTKEIGKITIGKIENKGRMNRRVNILIND